MTLAQNRLQPSNGNKTKRIRSINIWRILKYKTRHPLNLFFNFGQKTNCQKAKIKKRISLLPGLFSQFVIHFQILQFYTTSKS
jgi:hypothetical protein